ncbi:ankyrin repeat domain-containing protein [bacterium]|nr:ankyrin repeat domain-containing protein [bacterium]
MKFRYITLLLLLLFLTSFLHAAKVAVMPIEDRTKSIKPAVITASEQYIIKMLGNMGKYQLISSATRAQVMNRTPVWKKCRQMECQIAIGKALQADMVLTASVDQFAGIYTITFNFIDVVQKLKTEAGATDFNGTAVGMRSAIENIVARIHGKKEKKIAVATTDWDKKITQKYTKKAFTQKKVKEYVLAPEPQIVPIIKKVIPGKAIFSVFPAGATILLDPASPNEKKCTAPCTINNIPPGAHTVRITRGGYTAKDSYITITDGATLTRSFTLSIIKKSKDEINNALVNAAKDGKMKLVRQLANQGADINFHNQQGVSAVLAATFNNNRLITAYLVGRGAKFTPVEMTVLMHVVIDRSDQWLLTQLIKQRVNLNTRFGGGRTIIWVAAEKKKWKILTKLVAAGASLTIRDNTGKSFVQWMFDQGSVSAARAVIAAKKRVSIPQSSLLLKKAVTSENVTQLSLLLLLGVPVNTPFADGLTPLWYSAVKNRGDMVAILLQAGARATVKDRSGRSLMQYVIETRRYDIARQLGKHKAKLSAKEIGYLLKKGVIIGDTELVELLVSMGLNVNTRFRDGLSPLWIAAFNNNKEMISILADGGANLNIKDNQGRTVLMWSVQFNRKSIANLLITRGAKINLFDKKGRTALFNAVMSQQLRMVKMLVANGANTKLKDSNGNAPLHIATSLGDISVVQYLIEKGASVQSGDNHGNTPLLIALAKGYNDIALFLIDAKTNLDIANKDGVTPLIIAASKGNLPLVQTLVEREASINKQDKEGLSALIKAKRNNRYQVALYLLEKGATFDSRSEQDELMAYSTLNNYKPIVANLIARKVSVNRRFSDGLTPLFYAVRNGNTTIMKMIKNAGADLEARNRDGLTVLLYATSKRAEQIPIELIKLGANPNVKDRQKNTPLLLAAARGFRRLVGVLIKKGVNVNAKDSRGRNAMIRAKFTGNYDIVDMLQRAGAYE